MGLIELANPKSAIAKFPALASGRASRPIPKAWRVCKRGTDLIVGALLLIACSPLIALAALGIMIVSPGAPFFVQARVGHNGRVFKMFKLRTMVCGAHLMHDEVRHLNEVDGPVFKVRNDPRLHAFGALLRKTSIDELPNFFNVLIGDMSIVGPRPPLPGEVEHYSDFALRRLTVKPGITCLWQISGRSNLSFEEWMRLDNHYIDNWTPLSDLVIIAKTLPAVIKGIGAH